MAYRKVDVKVWGDEKFRSLPATSEPDAQKIWLRILLHPDLTGFGAMAYSLAGEAEYFGWGLEGFREAFAKVSGKALVRYDEKSRFLVVSNFLKQPCNRPQSPNVVRSWGKIWPSLPECELKSHLYTQLKAFTKGLGEGYAKAFEEAIEKPSPNQELELELDTGTEVQPPVAPLRAKRTAKRVAAPTSKATDRGCTSSDGSQTPTHRTVEQLIPGLPAFNAAIKSLDIELGLIANLILETGRPATVLAAALVTDRDVKCRLKKRLDPIKNHAGWMRTVLAGKIPDDDYDAAKGMLKSYGVRKDELSAQDAEQIGEVLERIGAAV